MERSTPRRKRFNARTGFVFFEITHRCLTCYPNTFRKGTLDVTRTNAQPNKSEDVQLKLVGCDNPDREAPAADPKMFNHPSTWNNSNTPTAQESQLRNMNSSHSSQTLIAALA